VPEIPTLLSLGVIIVTLVITTVLTLYKTWVHDVRNNKTQPTPKPTKPLDSR
jgi:tellurite resistance protein TerC